MISSRLLHGNRYFRLAARAFLPLPPRSRPRTMRDAPIPAGPGGTLGWLLFFVWTALRRSGGSVAARAQENSPVPLSERFGTLCDDDFIVLLSAAEELAPCIRPEANSGPREPGPCPTLSDRVRSCPARRSMKRNQQTATTKILISRLE